MKTNEKKEQFILLRAEGLSYAKIAEELHISKSTCSKWERDFSAQITTAKEERLADLYNLYRIGKEAYIEKLGEILKRIDSAIAEKDLAEIPAEKLLRLKLEYEHRLQAQRTEPTEGDRSFSEYTHEEMLDAVAALYERIKTGAISTQQAKTELATLEGVQKAINSKEAQWA